MGHRLLVKGVRISSIAAISSEGLSVYETLIGTTNGDNFFRGSLIPSAIFSSSKINCYNGQLVYSPRVAGERAIKSSRNCTNIPTPDYNPCEEMFSYIKHYLKDHDEILQSMNTQSRRQILHSALESVTALQCKHWISHSGYTLTSFSTHQLPCIYINQF